MSMFPRPAVQASHVVRPCVMSEADFEARAAELQVSADELARLKTLKCNTFGRLAFACNYVPGHADDAPLRALGRAIAGVDPAPDDRMVFEAYTLAAADLKMRVDRKDDDLP